MQLERVPRSLCAVITSGVLALAPVACKDEKTSEPEKGPEGGVAGEGAVGEPEGKPDGTKVAGDDGPKAGGLAAKALAAAGAVVGPRDIQPSYPVELDTVLDLVPADAESFFVVRDIEGLVHGTLAYATAQKSVLTAMADEMAKTEPGDADDLREALETIEKIGTELEKSGIDLSAGLVFAKSPGPGEGMMVYGSAKADALPTMLTAFGAKDEKMPKDCVVLASAAGYSVCGKTGAASFTPGKKAGDLRAKITAALPGVDLERANIVALIDDDGARYPFVVETGQGMAHVAFAAPSARAELAKLLEPSKAPALGLVGPGQPFVWAQLSADGLRGQMGPPPAMAKGVVDSLTGEVVFGGVGGVHGFAIAAGVSDATPAAGLIALATMGLGEVPKELPDGTKLAVAVETIKTASAGVQAIHAKFSGGPQEAIVKELGYASEVFAFAAGGFAALTFGAGDEIVSHVGGYTGTGPSEELLGSLPSPLASSLRDGKAAVAVHAPFDALQSDAARVAIDKLVDQIPKGEMGKADPDVVTKIAIDAMSPLSSASVWVTDIDTGPVFHVAVQGFGVVGTEEGKAAFDALEAVGGGGDRKGTYAALAAKYPASPRASSYKARAGELGDPVGSLLVVSTLGGIAGALVFMRAVEAIAAPTVAAEEAPKVAPAVPPEP